MADSNNEASELRTKEYCQGKENYDRLLSVFHTGTHVKRCLLEQYLYEKKLDLFEWLTSLNQTSILTSEDVKRAIKRSSTIHLTDLELTTLDVLLEYNCYDMFWKLGLMNTTLEDILNSHKKELYRIYRDSIAHNQAYTCIEQYTPSLTLVQWQLLFETHDGLLGVKYSDMPARTNIQISRLDNNLTYLILYVVCPLFKSVITVSNCQIQISKIAALNAISEKPEFDDIWDSIEANIVEIGSHCKLSNYFQTKCIEIKQTIFNRTLSQENRKCILEDLFNKPDFIRDKLFCNRVRKELDLILVQENLNLARNLCGGEMPILLVNNKYTKGAYVLSVLEKADQDLQICKSVCSNQAGSIPHNKQRTKLLPVKSDYDTPKYTRLTMKKYNLVVNDPYTDPEEKARRSARAAKLLRPKSEEVSVPKKPRNPSVNDKRPDFNSYRTVCVYKMEEMWNKAFREHQQKSPACEGKLSCDLQKEEKRGFSSRQTLICERCSYISNKYSLYEELDTGKPGRKPSKLDTAVHVGLSQTPIASSSMRKIILSGNMQAPAASSLQRRANKVLKNIVDVNKMDLRKRKNEIIEINRLRGKEDPNTISVQMDGMYNNPLYSGVGRTPFQPATQTVYTAAENITTDHNILSINIKNKLCSKHSSLEVDPDSGRLHAECTDECSANIPMVKSIGDEYTWAKECILDLKADNIEVEHLVTDPDSSAYRAAQDLYEEGTTSTKPEHFLDTRHVSENIRKRTKNDKNLLQIMPARTQVKRQKLLNCFSVDLTERCNAELAQARKYYSGNFLKIICKISHVVDAIVNCYTGNHLLCKKHSFLCNGLQKLWLRGRSLLPKTFKIAHSQQNIDFIRKTVNLRLGPNMLEKTRLNMNTNFVEGFNRSLRRSLPSNVTFKRNVTGRAHSAAHSVNFGPGESVLELCTALHCEVPVGGSAYKALKEIQKVDILQKQHKKTMQYKQFRSDKRAKLYKLYEKLSEIIEYEKNMLLKSDEGLKSTPKKHSDHSYSRNDRKRKRSVRK